MNCSQRKRHLPGPDGVRALEIPGYLVQGELGRGGVGVVYRAIHLSLLRPVALKMPIVDRQTGAASERFLREIRALMELRHPHVVRVYDCGQHAGSWYYAMELLEGETLGALAARHAGLRVPRALRLVRQAADALAACRALGQVHRDVKPSNMFVGPDDHLTLMDFGLVKGLDAGRVTTTGKVVGTPLYIAPEVLKGEAASAASDVYALGLTVHEVLSGETAFPALPMIELIDEILRCGPPPLRSTHDTVPRALSDLVLAMTAPDPRARPSAGEVAARLDELLSARAGGGALRRPARQRAVAVLSRMTPATGVLARRERRQRRATRGMRAVPAAGLTHELAPRPGRLIRWFESAAPGFAKRRPRSAAAHWMVTALSMLAGVVVAGAVVASDGLRVGGPRASAASPAPVRTADSGLSVRDALQRLRRQCARPGGSRELLLLLAENPMSLYGDELAGRGAAARVAADRELADADALVRRQRLRCPEVAVASRADLEVLAGAEVARFLSWRQADLLTRMGTLAARPAAREPFFGISLSLWSRDHALRPGPMGAALAHDALDLLGAALAAESREAALVGPELAETVADTRDMAMALGVTAWDPALDRRITGLVTGFAAGALSRPGAGGRSLGELTIASWEMGLVPYKPRSGAGTRARFRAAARAAGAEFPLAAAALESTAGAEPAADAGPATRAEPAAPVVAVRPEPARSPSPQPEQAPDQLVSVTTPVRTQPAAAPPHANLSDFTDAPRVLPNPLAP